MRTLKASQTLTLKLAGAVTANQLHWEASWINTITDVPDQDKGQTNDTSAVVAVTAPTSGVHLLSHLDVVNKDTVAATVIVEITGGTTREIVRRTLAAGESADLLNPKGGQGDPGVGVDDIHALPEKTTPVGGDEMVMGNSAAAYAVSRLSLTNLVTYLGTALNGVFAAIANGVQAIHALTEKTTPVNADEFVIADSAASNAPKRLTLANLKTAITAAPQRWTQITDFDDTAPAAAGVLFSAEFSGLEEWAPSGQGLPWLPLRWKCTGDTSYRYGAMLGVSPKASFTASGHTGTAQAGTSTSVTLASGASASDDAYNNLWLIITGGTGAGQYRQVSNYTGSTKVAELAGTPLPVTPDATSTYALVHMVVYGCPFDTGANAIEELWYGRRDMLFNVCALVPGVYSDQIADTELFSTLVGGIIPYDRPQSYVIGFSVWHKTPDTGTQPKINVACHGHDVSTADSGNGVQAPATVAAGSTGSERVFNPIGECDTGITLMTYGGSIETGASGMEGAIEIILKAPGGNGDAEDLTVNVICVET